MSEAPKTKVLFICTRNSARSQLAEGMLNALMGDRYQAYSAGAEATEVNPLAIKSLAEIGIDISAHRSKSVGEFLGQEFDVVVTLCNHIKESCSFFPDANSFIHKGFDDPSEWCGTGDENLEQFRRLRDEIKAWLQETFGKEGA